MAGLLRNTVRNVTTAGTRVPLIASQTFISSVTGRARRTNTGSIYLGDNTISSTGSALAAGDTVTISHPYQFDLADEFIDSSVNGEGVDIWYMLV